MAFRREKYVPRGGPAGGDGGRGGTVFLVGDAGLNTLYHLRSMSIHAADRGRHGEGSNRTGRSGVDLEIPVPLGTQVFSPEDNRLIAEVVSDGQKIEVARGGRGGRGNSRFTSPTNQAPRTAEPGEAGAERFLRLELKLLADVGIVGLPNSGKSTFIRVVSAARPKVADYPFTTLVPTLGVVTRGLDDRPFVIADLPGLIPGAAEGAGLGHRFLRHVERCRVLLHFVDVAQGESGAADELIAIERELAAFDISLMERRRYIVGSKLDAAAADRRRDLRSAAHERGLEYFELSSVDKRGVDDLITAVVRELTEARA